jgi:hypothetical protein
MSTSQPYPLQPRTDARRARIRGLRPRPRNRATERSGVVPVMGPPGRAPGIPIMGAQSGGLYLMGGPDPRPPISDMGGVDPAPSLNSGNPSERQVRRQEP